MKKIKEILGNLPLKAIGVAVGFFILFIIYYVITVIKKFFKILLSDSNYVSSKRVIGILCIIMFMAYGIKSLFLPFNLNFWVFYVSLCSITIWAAFRFISIEKTLKYNTISQLSKFKDIKEQVTDFIQTESLVDDIIQPNINHKNENSE